MNLPEDHLTFNTLKMHFNVHLLLEVFPLTMLKVVKCILFSLCVQREDIPSQLIEHLIYPRRKPIFTISATSFLVSWHGFMDKSVHFPFVNAIYFCTVGIDEHYDR